MTEIQLTSADGYNTKNMIFSKAEQGEIPNSPVKYHRIRLTTEYPDGQIGDLIIPTSKIFSYGVQAQKDFNDPTKTKGYQMPLCLWNKNGATADEKAFTDTFDNIVKRVKEYLLTEEVKEEIEKYELDEADLKNVNPLYWKREKGRIVEGRGPTLYAKLIESKKNGIVTAFIDEKTNEEIMNPTKTLVGSFCHVTAAIKFESIFIGSKISLQVKLYEAVVEKADGGPTRLLRPNATRPVAIEPVKTESIFDGQGEGETDKQDDKEVSDSSDSEDDEGSLDSVETQEAPPPPAPKKEVKRVVKKKVVKRVAKA